MSDPEVVTDDVATEQDTQDEKEGRERRWWGLLAVILILLLLLCCIVTAADVWVRGGPEQARFIARNLECLQCHTELIPDFSRATVHNPFANRDCRTCHTPHGEEVTVIITSDGGRVFQRYRTMLEWLPLKWWFELSSGPVREVGVVDASAAGAKTVGVKGTDSQLVLPETELCWMCHGNLGAKLSEAYQHQPFEAGRCTSCHNPHASDNTMLLSQAPNKLCFTCHPIGAQLMREQVHPPAAEGWCTDCHNPHASDFRGILVARQRELCFRCHPSVAVLDGLPVQHQPFLDDNCTGCHEPHGSDYTPLLDDKQPDLCYKCHPNIRNQFAQASSHPIGIALRCASCHDPHAAQYSALLNARNNDFCFQCHGTYQVTYDANAHKGQLCIRCHTPHGSPNAPILRAKNPSLCLQCHSKTYFDRPKNHPVQPTYYDVNARKPLTCTTSCHNPHGTDKNFMLRFFKYPQDGNCLMCHAVTRGNRVGIDF